MDLEPTLDGDGESEGNTVDRHSSFPVEAGEDDSHVDNGLCEHLGLSVPTFVLDAVVVVLVVLACLGDRGGA